MKYFLLFFFVSISSFAQDINKTDENGKKHGLWKGVYEESKRPRYEGTFNHGKETGTFKFFDDTKAGTVIATREFSAKDNSCYTIFYNQNNKKVSEGKLINKLNEGEWKYYHENSDTIMSKEFYINGKLNGVKKVFYKRGKIAEETNYKNGLKEGIYKKYAENGVVLEESIYKNNQYNGIAIFRDSENNIVAKGLFKDDKKSGIWEFLENGKLVKRNMNLQGKKFQKRTKPILDEYNK
jgi:antitoxin component YwqK of YwqJK toxin-antitoxin module